MSKQIILDRQGSSRSFAKDADLCRASCSVVLWVGPPLTAQPMYNSMGIEGHTPIASPRAPYIL